LQAKGFVHPGSAHAPKGEDARIRTPSTALKLMRMKLGFGDRLRRAAKRPKGWKKAMIRILEHLMYKKILEYPLLLDEL